MKRTYAYAGFSVVVETEPVRVPSALPRAPQGFHAVVHIATIEGIPITTPMRLTLYGEHPFASEAEALMAGHSAGQRMIEDVAKGEHEGQ